MFYKTIHIPVKCNKQDLNYLYSLNKLSAEVWSLCIKLNEKHREEHNGNWIQRNELQKLTKQCVPLHAKGIHHVVHKYLYARDAISKARKAGRMDEKYPYKKKKYFTTGWDVQSIKVDYANGILFLSKPNIIIDSKTKKQKPIKCHSNSLPKNIVEVELIWRGKLYFAIKYKEDDNCNKINNNNNTCSTDLGEIHSITSIDNNGNSIIITGRKMRSIKQLRNKNQARLYKRLSKCTKGSKQYWKYRKALERLKYKHKNKINDCVHKISKHFVDYCLYHGISKVYYGDLDSCTRNTKERKVGAKAVRQKLSQWNYGQLMLQLENKLTRYGIELVKVKEYYTSKKCPNCKTLNKPKGREYECSCGYKQHRDIVGAINILNDNHNINIIKYISKKYLQIT